MQPLKHSDDEQKHLLTFELETDVRTGAEQLHIHLDQHGLELLLRELQKLKPPHDHFHLMTPSWGGWELSEAKQGEDDKLLNMVTIHYWGQK